MYKKAMEMTDDFLGMIEPMLAKNTFIMGEKLTVVDFWVAGCLYCDKADQPKNLDVALWKPIIAKYPNFKRYGESFKKENAAWLMKRPDFPF